MNPCIGSLNSTVAMMFKFSSDESQCCWRSYKVLPFDGKGNTMARRKTASYWFTPNGAKKRPVI